jgi:hypothetical protein
VEKNLCSNSAIRFLDSCFFLTTIDEIQIWSKAELSKQCYLGCNHEQSCAAAEHSDALALPFSIYVDHHGAAKAFDVGA